MRLEQAHEENAKARQTANITTMNPDLVTAITAAWAELEALGVEHLDVFGSEARGEATPESDVDVIVHLRRPSLRGLVAVRDRLTALLGRRVDVLTPAAVMQRPRLRERVLREAIRVA
jgi:predicted nucleotidyltransferase